MWKTTNQQKPAQAQVKSQNRDDMHTTKTENEDQIKELWAIGRQIMVGYEDA